MRIQENFIKVNVAWQPRYIQYIYTARFLTIEAICVVLIFKLTLCLITLICLILQAVRMKSHSNITNNW